jgi:inner membrane protein
MEPVTHILTGACMARAGLNRRAAYTTLTMAVAAEFPDIDTLWGFLRGPIAGFQHHRGITHTFIALPVEAGLIVAAIYALHRVRIHRAPADKRDQLTQAPVRWGLLYAFALLALLSHLALDYSNNYGLRPFAPFNPHWYEGSFVFIFDPLIFLLLVLAFLLPLLFGLIGNEVGARRQRFRGRGWATAALIGIVILWSLRAIEHTRAEQIAMTQSMAITSDGAATDASPHFMQPLRVLANPDPFSPFHWHIVSDFGDFYQLSDVQLLTGSLTPSQSIQVKPALTPAIIAAEASPLGRVYMDWSPMPFIVESPPGDPARPVVEDGPAPTSAVITFRDPRFMVDLPLLRSRNNPPLTAAIELDAHNHVLHQSMDGSVQR